MGEATETAMSRRLNWERANLNKKPKQSLSDEREFMERDRAARWLEHQEQTRQLINPQIYSAVTFTVMYFLRFVCPKNHCHYSRSGAK
jgi:hypothetical protein